MGISTVVGAIGLLAAIGVFLSNFLRIKVDPREPPVVHPSIPLLGHIIGMLTEGPLYLKKISEKCKQPIFTMPMLNDRTYVVTSPPLAMAVQRAAATLDFDQLVVEMTPRMFGLSAETKHILQDPTAKQEGRERMVTRSHYIITPALGPQKVREIAETQLNLFGKQISDIEDGMETELFRYITRGLTKTSMQTFYGPENPFALHPELVESFWDWETGAVAYMVNVLPKITARKAYYGLEACVKGFVEYFENGRGNQALTMLQDRKKMHEDEGISLYEHCRLEMAFSFAISSNAGITSFWVVNNIFSRPELVSQIREEISANALVAPGTISASRLKDSCPLLSSVYRETMRITAPMASARFVLEDTILADTYLLRKNTTVQIAGGVMHADGDIWGPDVSSFNARRFMHNLNGSKSNADGSVPEGKANAIHPAAFRAFGGGSSLCPGRHFAQAEISGLVALLVLGFDLLPVEGAQKVQWDPPRDDKRFPLSVTKPLREVRVKMQRRKGMEDVKWVFTQ
ncbi:cytochrome P450 [Dothidotthia symphoricarpi CBS 119687]|uniref:Cytochrome P450 n=1 Tax=Dothidotthia symphoricarpi CBS 119687 TaxID=1392245 RepID=A0A6A6A1F7_9PLEO|nr:cytochrome P450 [Dothidotthia symphoricarpi CBS 119687]KAF2125356.1 cytochrome P450 [Dothidotthia symphoricarpi CBS 119687]